MAEYIFVLGRTGDLCRWELVSVLARKKISYQTIFSSSDIFHLSTATPLDLVILMGMLGGTVKIAEVFGKIENSNENSLIDKIISHFQVTEERKIIFGLSGYQGISFNVLKQWNKSVKEGLEELNLIARYLLPTEGTTLSSVVLKKQKAREILVVAEGENFVLAQTLAITDFEDWGKRDFGRPAVDPGHGMLPLKVARMMINLGGSEFHVPNSELSLLDPFCGVGTILQEAMFLGFKVLGSDQSREALEKTRKNLDFLKNNFKLQNPNDQLFQLEATQLTQKMPKESINLIVTEPYLGPMEGKTQNLKNIVLGLEKLYLGCFREWLSLLTNDGKIVIALPSFKVGNQQIFVKKPIDICETLGYTLFAGPYPYSRPQARVIRNIYILKKHGSH